jgi:hypothetical protein
MPFEFAIVLISTIGTAVWTVVTWAQQEEKERVAEQDQLDAIYVNPFLLAVEDLQSLLYRILANGEIEFLRTGVAHKGDNEGEITYHEALEIVYVIVKYFGWSLDFYRYGSYTQDKTAIKLTRNISRLFADRQTFGDDPFRFTPSKQFSLGEVFVKRVMGTNSSYAEFKTVPLYEFDQEVMESKEQMGHLYQDISRTLDAIRRANSGKELEGRERLSAIQNELVDLANYIESQEEFTVAHKNRKKVELVGNEIIVQEAPLPNEIDNFIKWLPLPALSQFLPNKSSTVVEVPQSENRPEIVHRIKGRIRLKVPQLFGNESYAKELQALIQPITGVKSIQVNQEAASVIIHYENQLPESEFERILLEKIDSVRVA